MGRFVGIAVLLFASLGLAAPEHEPVSRVAYLRLRGDLAAALELAEATLKSAPGASEETVELWLEVARIHDRIGLHRNTRPVAKALEAIRSAEEIAAEVGALAIAKVHLQYADYHYRAEMSDREFPTATRYAREALRAFERLEEVRGQADAAHKIGLIHYQRRELDEARSWFDRSLELDRAAGARPWFCGEYERHVAFLDLAAEERASAIRRFRESLRCRKQAGAVDASLFAALSLGSSLVAAGSPAEARESLAYALEIAGRIDSPRGRASASLAQGRMHEALGEIAAAHSSYRSAAETADEIGLESTRSAAIEGLERLRTSN